MMEFRFEGSEIRARQSQGVRAELIDVVIDLDGFGSPLGVEVLGLLYRYPLMARHLQALTAEGIPMSVDEDADAIYLRVAEGRSLDQVTRLAAIAVGPDDALLGMHVRLEV